MDQKLQCRLHSFWYTPRRIDYSLRFSWKYVRIVTVSDANYLIIVHYCCQNVMFHKEALDFELFVDHIPQWWKSILLFDLTSSNRQFKQHFLILSKSKEFQIWLCVVRYMKVLQNGVLDERRANQIWTSVQFGRFQAVFYSSFFLLLNALSGNGLTTSWF